MLYIFIYFTFSILYVNERLLGQLLVPLLLGGVPGAYANAGAPYVPLYRPDP